MATPGIYKKINLVMKAVRGVGKDSLNKHGGYKYAGHEAVTDALRDEFARVGIVRVARMKAFQVLDGGTVQVEVVVSYHDTEDGSSIDIPMFALQPSQTTGKSVTAQQVGQALSYAVKNVEFKLFALTGDPEPDSDESDTDPERHEASDRAADQMARALLERFATAKTVEEVEAVNAECKRNWPKLKGIDNLAEGIVASRTNALKRIRAAAEAES